MLHVNKEEIISELKYKILKIIDEVSLKYDIKKKYEFAKIRELTTLETKSTGFEKEILMIDWHKLNNEIALLIYNYRKIVTNTQKNMIEKTIPQIIINNDVYKQHLIENIPSISHIRYYGLH